MRNFVLFAMVLSVAISDPITEDLNLVENLSGFQTVAIPMEEPVINDEQVVPSATPADPINETEPDQSLFVPLFDPIVSDVDPQASIDTESTIMEPEITPVSQPEVTVMEPVFGPTSSDEPAAEPTTSVDPVTEPTVEPTLLVEEPTVEPVVVPPASTAEPTAEPVADPTSGPVAEPTVEPVVVPPTSEPTVEPVIEPTFEVLASEPVVEPTAQPAVEPTVEPAAQPTEEPPVEPVIEPTFEVLASEPVVEPTAQPTVEPTVEPAAQPTEEPPVEPTTEPVAVVPEPELTSEVVIAAPTEVVLGPEPSAEASPTEVVFAPIADPSPTEVALPDPTFVDAEPVASASAVFIPLPTDGVALAAEVIVPSTTTLEPPTETFDIPALVSNNLNFIAGGLGISADTDVQQNSDSSLDWDSRPVSFPNVPNRGRDPTNSNNVQGNTFSPSVTVFIIGITLCAVLVVAGLVGFARYRKRVPQPQIEEPKIIMVPAMERIPSPEMLNLVTELEQTGVSTLAINRIMESFRVSESGSRQAEILRDSLDMFDIAMPLVAEYAESVYQNTDRDDPFNDARSYTSSFE